MQLKEVLKRVKELVFVTHLLYSFTLDISGVPGTGKTATVHEVLLTLQNKTNGNQLPEFICAEINAMKLTEPIQAYAYLYRKLEPSKKKVTPTHAMQLLDRKFRPRSGYQKPM